MGPDEASQRIPPRAREAPDLEAEVLGRGSEGARERRRPDGGAAKERGPGRRKGAHEEGGLVAPRRGLRERNEPGRRSRGQWSYTGFAHGLPDPRRPEKSTQPGR